MDSFETLQETRIMGCYLVMYTSAPKTTNRFVSKLTALKWFCTLVFIKFTFVLSHKAYALNTSNKIS